MADTLTHDDRAAIRACFNCSAKAADRLTAEMAVRSVPHRGTVALAGDEATQLLFVVEGAVCAELFGIDGQQAQLARHGPGEVFGAYPAETVYRANMTAVGQTRLLSIPTRKLRVLAAEDGEIANGIAELLARQLDLVLDRMAARIGLSATGRFYRALLMLADDEGMIRPAPVVAAMALSVHTTRETGSRALAALLRRGIAERLPDGLRIVSRRMLEDLVV